MLFDPHNFFFLTQKNQVDREHHSDGVHSPGRHDPESTTQLGPPLSFSQQADQPAAEPVSIEKGMTPDQVEGAMGKPDKKVTLGVKQIYYYKDMKVIFMNGKVSDVQ